MVEVVAAYATEAGIAGITSWTEELLTVSTPKKADQDRLDAVLCALIGYHWRSRSRKDSIKIGDLNNGYIVAPVSPDTRQRLEAAAHKCGVPVDHPELP